LSYPLSKTIIVDKTNCDVHPLSDQENRHRLIPADSLLLPPEKFANLLATAMEDKIVKKDKDDDNSVYFTTIKGTIKVNKNLDSPKSEYVITKNHVFAGEKYRNYSTWKNFLKDIGYEMYGVEHWGSIGSDFKNICFTICSRV
jgi:hypothetical protein